MATRQDAWDHVRNGRDASPGAHVKQGNTVYNLRVTNGHVECKAYTPAFRAGLESPRKVRKGDAPTYGWNLYWTHES